MPTRSNAPGITHRIHRYSQAGTGRSPPADSACMASLRFIAQPTVTAATSAPSVCMPEPNVRSHGTKIWLLIIGGIAIRNATIAMSHTTVRLDNRVLSVSAATSTSNAASPERYPAPSRLTKNSRPNSHPAGMATNTFGSVAKMSPGPLFGSRPSEKTAGKIANPASSPENVSPNAVHHAFAVRLSFSVRYDPYTTMNVPPSESENTVWPMAAIMTRGVRSDSWNLRMYHSTPAIALGSVSARPMSKSRMMHSVGMTMLLARSMPLRRPRRSTNAQESVTAAV